MDPKGGNPFLMDDFSSGADDSAAAQSNPFLSGFDDPGDAPSSGLTDNPFFNFTSDQSYQSQTDGTNPFASFGAEAAVPEPEKEAFVSPETATMPLSNTANVFAEGDLQKEQTEVVESHGRPERPPTRPPPPRPPPPPRSTKDLVLSVTESMEETSSQMLDRLEATRTPSPTLMHSPSPTPEHSFADLVDVDSNVPDIIPEVERKSSIVTDSNKTQDILGLHEATQSQSVFGTEAILSTLTETTVSNTKPLATSALPDEPFSSVGQQNAFQDGFDQKRPSLSAEAPAPEINQIVETASETPVTNTEITSISDHTATAFSSNIPSHDYPMSTVSQDFVATTATADSFSTVPSEPAAQHYSPPRPSADAFGAPAADAFGAPVADAFAAPAADAFSAPAAELQSEKPPTFSRPAAAKTVDAFDAFASKFDKAADHEATATAFGDPFGGGQMAMDTSSDVWGDTANAAAEPVAGFGDADGFDSFLSMTAPPPGLERKRRDSDDQPDFSVYIKPKGADQTMDGGEVPVLQPPGQVGYADPSSRFNPFDKSGGFAQDVVMATEAYPTEMTRSDSQETPPTPLFDEDVSQPLEDFPRVTYTGDGWEMQLRMPLKKKITGQRFWKKVFAKLVYQGDSPVLQLFNKKDDKDPFQELPLLACYSVSEIAAQQFDQYGKIFTVKLQYIFYKERPGVRPGQVTKAERITNKLSQFAAYAIQGDYQGVKEFGSDLKKLGLPVEHAPQISQLFKLGSHDYEDCKTFSYAIEEALFRLSAHRDRALQYKMEEVQVTVVDEFYVEQNELGHIERQIARVRVFFLGFLSGMPDVELGLNDMCRQGKEVVGRHDIIPMITEEWIRLENVEFHSCVQQDEYEKTKVVKFKPPDACYIELLRFRVRPPKNRELPLQLKAVFCVTGNKVQLNADVLVPGFASRKLGKVPCEDVCIRFPIPECWIYLFRVEKHFRYGSVKSAHRRTGKIKGIERFLGAVDTLEPQLMEVTSGQAKYEHQHHAIVWRMPRLPKEGQGAYSNHQLVCKMSLTSFDQIPEKLPEYAYVEFTMPITQVSHTTCRSVSFQNFDGDEPPEKCVRNLSRHEYRVGIEHTQGEGPTAYVAATAISKSKIPESVGETQDEGKHSAAAASDSDSSD